MYALSFAWNKQNFGRSHIVYIYSSDSCLFYTHCQIQQQIERLRISQMEKQLELKEASTRRKILALRQQLQGESVPVGISPTKQSMHKSAMKSDTKDALPVSNNDQTTTILKSRVQCRTESTDGLKDSQMQTPLSSKPQTTGGVESVSPQVAGETGPGVIYTQCAGDSEKKAVTGRELLVTRTGINSRITPSMRNTECYPQMVNDIKAKQHENRESSPSEVTSSSTSRSKTPCLKSRQRLALPEEIEETEYMSALQKQKARVSRIRRCIVAATVIQRAWRDYTSDKRINN